MFLGGTPIDQAPPPSAPTNLTLGCGSSRLSTSPRRKAPVLLGLRVRGRPGRCAPPLPPPGAGWVAREVIAPMRCALPTHNLSTADRATLFKATSRSVRLCPPPSRSQGLQGLHGHCRTQPQWRARRTPHPPQQSSSTASIEHPRPVPHSAPLPLPTAVSHPTTRSPHWACVRGC